VSGYLWPVTSDIFLFSSSIGWFWVVVSYLFKCTFSYPSRIAAVFELLRIPVARDIYRSLSNSWFLVLHGTLFDSGRATIDFEWSLFTCYKAHLPIVIEQQLILSGHYLLVTRHIYRLLSSNNWFWVVIIYLLIGTFTDCYRATTDFEWSLFTCY
jgi:hypothetical protein